MSSRRLVLFVAALLAWVHSAEAQGIDGRIIDEASRGPVAGAIVRIVDANGRESALTTSDSTGSWSVRVRAGTYRLRVERLGYARIETDLFQVGSTVISLNLSTRPQVVLLDTVGGSAMNYAGLLDRSRTNKAVRTLLPEDVERRMLRLRASSTSEILRFMVAGLGVRDDGGWPMLANNPLMNWESTSRGLSFGRTDFRSPWNSGNPRRAVCEAIVALDGVPHFYGRPHKILENLVALSEVRAVEVFNDPNYLPRELDLDARRNRLDDPIGSSQPRDGVVRCGVIVIWTKAGLGVP